MRRRFCVVGFALLVVGQIMIAQTGPTVPTMEEFKALLVKAYDQANLSSPGALAFHLRARSKAYGPKGIAMEGVCEFWWASPDLWREDVNWNGQTSSQIAIETHLSNTGEDTHRADTFRVTKVLRTWQGIYIDLPKAVIQARAGDSSGPAAVCLEDHQEYMPTQTICLGPETGSLLETQLGDQRWEYSDYAQISPTITTSASLSHGPPPCVPRVWDSFPVSPVRASAAKVVVSMNSLREGFCFLSLVFSLIL